MRKRDNRNVSRRIQKVSERLPNTSPLMEVSSSKNSSKKTAIQARTGKTSTTSNKATTISIANSRATTIVEEECLGRQENPDACRRENLDAAGEDVSLKTSGEAAQIKITTVAQRASLDRYVPSSQRALSQPILQDRLPKPIAYSGRGYSAFGFHNIPWLDWYDDLVQFMFDIYAPRMWSAVQITPAQGAGWLRYINQKTLEEPALFYVNLLLSCSELRLSSLLSHRRYCWLRLKSVQTIRQALQDESRKTSVGLILAVGRMALYQHSHDPQASAATMHRVAQRQMIDQRGGMAQLRLPPLVERLMRFSDRFMSSRDLTMRFLPEENVNDSDARSSEVYAGFAAWASNLGRTAMPE